LPIFPKFILGISAVAVEAFARFQGDSAGATLDSSAFCYARDACEIPVLALVLVGAVSLDLEAGVAAAVSL
jgi:hypothetical protein